MTPDKDVRENRNDEQWKQNLSDRLDKIEASLDCIRKARQDFDRQYGDLLKETLDARALRSKLWATATEELVRKGVWFAAVALIIGAAAMAKSHFLK